MEPQENAGLRKLDNECWTYTIKKLFGLQLFKKGRVGKLRKLWTWKINFKKYSGLRKKKKKVNLENSNNFGLGKKK